MSEQLKDSVLKTEVLITIPGVRIPLHLRSLNFEKELYVLVTNPATPYIHYVIILLVTHSSLILSLNKKLNQKAFKKGKFNLNSQSQCIALHLQLQLTTRIELRD